MRVWLTLAMALLALQVGAGSGKKNYGKTLTLSEVTKISAIFAAPETFNGKRVLVEGDIVGVCAKRGCWIKIASDREFESLTFKVEDGVIIFPLDAKGKKARAEGVLDVKTYTVEELIASGKKHAEESKEPFDPSTVKGPKTVITLKGEGAIVD